MVMCSGAGARPSAGDRDEEEVCGMKGEGESTGTARQPLQQPPIPRHISTELPVDIKNGFFGLEQLHDFFKNVVEKALRSRARPWSLRALASRKTRNKAAILLDFSAVKTWDIAAVLWLVVALDHYIEERGLNFILRLPEPGTKSAEFLVRWNFFGALKNLRPELLRVERQDSYLSQSGDRWQQGEPDDLLRYLLSQDLARIRNLADVRRPRDFRSINSWLTGECRDVFIESRIGFFLYERCGIPKPEANLFAKEIVNEAVLNIQRHPKATMGMVSLSLLEEKQTLVLAVADNGEQIPKTIDPHYVWSWRQRNGRSARRIAHIINDATQAATSRLLAGGRSSETIRNICMGLYYVRRDTTRPEVFAGELLVATDGVCVKFNTPPDDNGTITYRPDVEAYDFPWRGNLLRVSIPLTQRPQR